MLDHGLYKVALSLYEQLATPLALSSAIQLRYGEWDLIASRRIDPACYLDTVSGAEKFRRDYQAVEFLRKSPLLPISADLHQAAVKAFHDSEEQCLLTNTRFHLMELRRGTVHWTPFDAAFDKILVKAKRTLTRILGRLPDDLEFRFGPGTCYELRGSTFTTVLDKTNCHISSTPLAQEIFSWMLNGTALERDRMDADLPLPDTCPGNRFTSVPKDATKNRGICIEPLGNLVIQLGLGRAIKRKLGQVGLHVGSELIPVRHVEGYRPTPFQSKRPFDGQHYHQEMAREGSLPGGRWASIDLSNASDTIAKELVRRVMPEDWFQALSACRSPKTMIIQADGSHRWHYLEKFSSMGNGATFEVETGIFAAILAAGCHLEVGSNLFVYGDDILLPNESYECAVALLRACGFTPNDRKSFASGPFRESCGGDYFEGFNVRPCYADAEMSEPTDWIVLHNQIRRLWGSSRTTKLCRDRVPVRLRGFGPSFLGDRCFHGPFKPRRGRRGYDVVAVVVPTVRKVPIDRWGSCQLSAVFIGGCEGTRPGHRASGWVTPRGSPIGYRVRLASVS